MSVDKYFADEPRVSIKTEKTALGTASILNGSLAVISSPRGSSSQELRDLQAHFKTRGIALYYTFPWEGSEDKLYAHFSSKLGLDSRSYAAKKLTVELIPNSEGDRFMKNHHIQGAARGAGKISIALRDGDELLAVQQFARYRFRGIKGKGSVLTSPVWEGLRLCFKPGVQIHGGASRLQKFFEREFTPEEIISYVNLSHSDGSYKAHQGFDDVTDWNQDSYMWSLDSGPNDVKIIDKDGKERHPDLAKVSRMPYISPTRIAGGFGKGVGQTFYGGKLGSRGELRAHNGALYHNDPILEAIGYRRLFTSGQAKWRKVLREDAS